MEPRLDIRHTLFGMENDAVLGLRWHQEDIRRAQYRGNDASFQDLNFAMNNSLPRELIDIDVKARSYYAQNTSHIGHWSITPGVRVEQLSIITDVMRADGLAHDNLESRLNNKITKVLPGVGVAWSGSADTTLFAGMHQGFAPPRPDRDIGADGNDSAVVSKTRPEESTNFELGLRSRHVKDVTVEATLFNTTFDQIVINGATAGTFINGGQSQQSGIELAGRVALRKVHQALQRFYVTGSYTNLFTAKFKRDVASENIVSGNRLPYAPRNLASLSLGYQHASGVDARLGIDHVGSQFSDGENTRVETMSGTTGEIPAVTLFNASLSYRPKHTHASFFVSAHNLANREYLVSRVDGMVAGRKRQVSAGMRYDF
jgi:Fe(3+) dicitrate transport protein